MADASHIEVLKPGLATSVQDKGRQGYYHLGIPPSGALDQYALAAANLLVGNAEDAAVLECTLLGPELLFHRAALIAVTGATMAPKIDGKPMPCNMALAARRQPPVVRVRLGGRARLPGRGRRHRRAGGAGQPFDLYTGRHRRARGPPAQGRRQAGHRPTSPRARAGRELPLDLAAHCPKTQTLRVLPGLYDHRLEPESAATFYQDAWTVTSEADRIGYRYSRAARCVSRARTALRRGRGSVQHRRRLLSHRLDPGAGRREPIILHRDAVSGGGYAMIGTVISADMDKVGQMQPNQSARFEKVTLEQALVARREHHARYDRLRQALSG